MSPADSKNPLPSVDEWMRTSALLNRFCSQNGWIDSDTLRWDLAAENSGWRRSNIHFTEVVMEGSGCVAGRIECFGQVDLRLDAQGRVVDVRVV
ncbi:MAG: hypothetical protein LBV36_04655 [Chromatiales bacterium]|jgi:hypothetical protein|nr:hypothetical protein [Chromatiales bacterium]